MISDRVMIVVVKTGVALLFCLGRYENCTVVQSSYGDPFMQARAVWNDQACSTPAPYICEMRAQTSK
jgi:hypothetical protein